MAIADKTGHFVRVNPGFTDTLGYSLEDLTSRPFADFVHPDDLAATLAKYEELLAGGRAVGFENGYRGKDGAYRWILGNATGTQAGSPTARDATSPSAGASRTPCARRSNCSLLFEQPLGMTLNAPNRRVLRLNRAFADMFGHPIDCDARCSGWWRGRQSPCSRPSSSVTARGGEAAATTTR
jgi:PAS domain S-box-containing protein